MDQRLAAVIGYPVSHSLSPAIHGFWLKKHRIEGSYIPLPVSPEDLETVLMTLPKMGFSGANITLPHKEKAFKIVRVIGKVDQAAEQCGAINTIMIQDGRISGTNTDCVGFTASLDDELGDWEPDRSRVTILGSGGAARGLIVGLIEKQVREINLVNRTVGKAQVLADKFSTPETPITPVSWGEYEQVLGKTDILINATSLGMTGQPPLEVELDRLREDALVADIVYNPLETALLKQAREKGFRTMDGLGMLLHQAVPGFEAWYGVKPRVTKELRGHVEKYL